VMARAAALVSVGTVDDLMPTSHELPEHAEEWLEHTLVDAGSSTESSQLLRIVVGLPLKIRGDGLQDNGIDGFSSMGGEFAEGKFLAADADQRNVVEYRFACRRCPADLHGS